MGGVCSTPCVQDLEYGQTNQLFQVEIVLRVVDIRHQTPAILLTLLVRNVVLGPPRRVAQHLIGLVNQAKAASLPVSWLSGWKRWARRRKTRWIVSGSAFGLICSSS